MAGKLSGSAIQANTITATQLSSNIGPISSELKLIGSGISLNVANTGYFSGNVGIGTTTPNRIGFDTNAKVLTLAGPQRSFFEIGSESPIINDISGGIVFNSATNIKAGLYCRLDASSNGSLVFLSGGNTERVRITDTGNVGIGITNPGVKLHVEDGSMLLGDISGGSTSTPSGYKLQLDNSYAAGSTSTSYFPKIVMHEATTWLGGFGISDSHVDYFSGGSHRWFTGTNPSTPTRGTERLKIWDSGYVTMPTQTMFAAEHNETEAPAGGNPLLSWSVNINQGGGSWNASTATYTVPVAGKYLVTCSLLRNTGGAAGGVHLRVNGSIVLRLFFVDSTGTTAYAMGSGQYIVNCAASDTIQITNENTVSWYGDGTGLGSLTINLLG